MLHNVHLNVCRGVHRLWTSSLRRASTWNKIVRFESVEGKVLYGIPVEASVPSSSRTLSSAFPLISGSIWDASAEFLTSPVTVKKLLSPISPVAIFGIGLNYRDHAAETKKEIPQNPVVFMKYLSAVQNPGDPIVIPKIASEKPEVDYEAELAVVIGSDCRDVTPEHAHKHILGYTCANDVTARRWQGPKGGGQWVYAKSFDTFCPLGPALVSAEHVDPSRLAISTRLNGTAMQDGNTSDMIFSVYELVSFLSRGMTLTPGTVVLTGTPAGVGFARSPPVYLAPGDVVEVSIENIGTLSNPVVRERKATSVQVS